MINTITEEETIEREELVADGLMKASEVARLLALGRNKIYELMDNGTLPYVRIGKSKRIPRKSVTDFMTDNLVKVN